MCRWKHKKKLQKKYSSAINIWLRNKILLNGKFLVSFVNLFWPQKNSNIKIHSFTTPHQHEKNSSRHQHSASNKKCYSKINNNYKLTDYLITETNKKEQQKQLFSTTVPPTLCALLTIPWINILLFTFLFLIFIFTEHTPKNKFKKTRQYAASNFNLLSAPPVHSFSLYFYYYFLLFFWRIYRKHFNVVLMNFSLLFDIIWMSRTCSEARSTVVVVVIWWIIQKL